MGAVWQDLKDRWVLIDPETKRVVGQVVHNTELQWCAYDNDPAKHDGTSALLLGKFAHLQHGKKAVEKLTQQ